ncbi:hypothetical protein BgiBS90_006420, partial [Biomphalaria glabrata]
MSGNQAEVKTSQANTTVNGINSASSDPQVVIEEESGGQEGCCGRPKQKAEMVGTFEL